MPITADRNICTPLKINYPSPKGNLHTILDLTAHGIRNIFCPFAILYIPKVLPCCNFFVMEKFRYKDSTLCPNQEAVLKARNQEKTITPVTGEQLFLSV